MNQQLEQNRKLTESFKGGVIMDVTNAKEAEIAQKAGAVAVMALERVPSDIRKQGGVARMSDPKMIKEIQSAVSIPVMAKARIGHIAEAQILEALHIDYIDESEVLTPADDMYHLNKFEFKTPFVCGARNIGEALRRIGEGACMIRTKGEAGTGNVVEAVRHMRTMMAAIRRLQNMPCEELMTFAKENDAPYDLVVYVAQNGKLPVVNFAAGGVATPADAAGIGEIPMTFIRAPFVESVHADASENTPEILSIVEDRIVGVKYKNQIAFAFHPELDQDTRIHEAFLGMIR